MILSWKADRKIVTNSSCLSYGSNCFSTGQETIILNGTHHTVYRRNPCVFPFKHDNTTYDSCTKKPNMHGFWCATSVDANLDYQTWGHCHDLCPLEGMHFY